MSALRRTVVAVLLTSSVALVAQDNPSRVEFDVVSITRHAGATVVSTVTQRPDGGFTMLNIPLGPLIGRAYPPAVPFDMIGLPDWVMQEAGRREDHLVVVASDTGRTDRDATRHARGSLQARRTRGNPREPIYNLIVMRHDGRLGPNITPSEADCEARAIAGIPPPSAAGVVPPCTNRAFLSRVEGDLTMAALVRQLRLFDGGREVVDQTGLTGSYRIVLTFDVQAALRGPDAAPAASDAPALFTALQEQLGLKLEPSKAMRDVLVIDHIERPTEN